MTQQKTPLYKMMPAIILKKEKLKKNKTLPFIKE